MTITTTHLLSCGKQPPQDNLFLKTRLFSSSPISVYKDIISTAIIELSRDTITLACPLFFPLKMALQQSKPKFAPHICIIGAGVAGLRCADVLLRKGGSSGDGGLKVTVLEGRERVGGRVSFFIFLFFSVFWVCCFES